MNMADAQTVPAPDPLTEWWAGKKAPKSQLNEQLEASLYISDSDVPKKDLVSEHAIPEPKPARKRRSDAGIPKAMKIVAAAPEPTSAGVLTQEHKARLLLLVGCTQQLNRECFEAEAVVAQKRVQLDQAERDLQTYLDTLSRG